MSREDEYKDLLDAIAEALDVPLPVVSPTDQAAWSRLLSHRSAVARVAADTPGPGAAAWVRQVVAENPVNYRVFEAEPATR